MTALDHICHVPRPVLYRTGCRTTAIFNKMSPNISPSPVKRRRLHSSSTGAPAFRSEDHSLRIYAWNINGITPFIPAPQKKISSFFAASPNRRTKQADSHALSSPTPDPPTGAGLPGASLRDFLRRHNWPQLLLLQEVKIAPTDIATQNAVRHALSAGSSTTEPDYEAHFVLPTDPHNARGFGRKVHGVCSIVRSDFASSSALRFRTVDWDAEGRFSIVEIDGGPETNWPKLSIWNVYAVNGTEFDYRSPETGVVVGTRHDRKLEVQRLMSEEVRRLETEGYGVVLAGDMNIARDVRDGFPRLRTKPHQHVLNRKDFTSKFFDAEQGLGMVDSFRELHGEERRYTYFSRGVKWGESCDRVDYVICSAGLRASLVEADMLDSEAERGSSDHVPVFASFSFAQQDSTSRPKQPRGNVID